MRSPSFPFCRFILPALCWIALLSSASAHPGDHGGGVSSGFAHPWFGLDHLIAMIAVGVLATRLPGARRAILPLVFLGSMALGMLLAGWLFPSIVVISEWLILISLAAFGALLISGRQLTLPWMVAGVSLVAIGHGAAHASEIAAGASTVPYLIGCLLGTALLHGLGLMAGILAQRVKLTWVPQAAGVACLIVLVLVIVNL